MGDLYGISNAVMEANSLHGQIALNEELAKKNYDDAFDKFNTRIKNQKSGDSQSNEISEAEDLPTLNSVYQLGNGIYSGVKSGAASAGEAYNLARSGVAPAGTLTGEAFLEESGRVMSGAAEGAGVGRATLAGARGAASGFVRGLSEAGGEAQTFGQELTGAEGITQKVITGLGGGETLGFVAGKAAGAAGGIIAAGQQIDSLIESGGKSMFTRVNAQGQRVAMSGTDKASEILNEAGAVADVVAAGTGGLLVPVAAALNLAGAVTGVIGSYLDEKADDKNIGLKADGTTDASKAPKLAAQPVGEAFTGLGFVGNMSHNPLDHIS